MLDSLLAGVEVLSDRTTTFFGTEGYTELGCCWIPTTLHIIISAHMLSNAACAHLQALVWLEVPAIGDVLAGALARRDLQGKANFIR